MGVMFKLAGLCTSHVVDYFLTTINETEPVVVPSSVKYQKSLA